MANKDGDLYLLKITWQDDMRDYRHRFIFTRAHDPEKLFESFAKSHPEWDELEDSYRWGHVNPKSHTTGAVFKVSEYDDKSWGKWVRRKRKEYEQKQVRRAREADMKELQRIVDKWGISALEALAACAEQDKKE